MLGYKRIPDNWKSGIPAIADRKFAFTNFSFRSIVDSTMKRATAQAQQNGGQVDGERMMLPVQNAAAAKLELWDDYGSPREADRSDGFPLEMERRLEFAAESGSRFAGAHDCETRR